MATLKIVGTPPQNDVRPTVGQDVVPQSYVQKLLAGNMSSNAVTAQVNQLLSGYASTAQANAAMTGLATPSWIQAQTAAYALASTAGLPNGPVSLSSPSGLVPVGQIDAASTQTWPLPFWSPPSYNQQTVTSTGDEELLYTMAIADPGWPYVLFCAGMVDTEVGLTDVASYELLFTGMTGGTFTLTFGAVTTAAIAYNAAAATIKSALAALSSVVSATVTGTLSSGLYIEIQTVSGGLYLSLNNTSLSGGTYSLTGGSYEDGTFAQVLVRQGGSTGQVVAVGYGVGESYTGPTPGTSNSQAFVNSTFSCTGNWVTVTGMLANTGTGYSSTMVGNYLQAPTTMNATVTASFAFSGATVSTAKGAAAVSTAVQIVDQAGNVIVTGSAVTGNAGTATATWTGPVTAGQLFGVQIGEASAAKFATVTGGTLTIAAPPAINQSVANVLPVPFADQLSTTGATSLSVMLKSSSASGTQVTASTDFPGLWVMPIPWVAQTPPPAVAFDAAGVGYNASGTAPTCAHTVAANAYLIVDIVVDRGSSITSAAYGTLPLTLLRSVSFASSAVSGASATSYRFAIANPPAGTANVVFKLSATAACTVATQSYLNVASAINSSVTAVSGASEINLTCVSGQMMVASIATSSSALTSPAGGTVRSNVGKLCVQDSAAASANFTAALASTQGWGAIGTVLVA